MAVAAMIFEDNKLQGWMVHRIDWAAELLARCEASYIGSEHSVEVSRRQLNFPGCARFESFQGLDEARRTSRSKGCRCVLPEKL